MDAMEVPASRPVGLAAGRLRTLLVLAVVAILVGVVAWVVDKPTDDGVTLVPGAAAGTAPRAGNVPPDFQATAVDGTAVSMAALKGKPT